jgi:hypothetical protein
MIDYLYPGCTSRKGLAGSPFPSSHQWLHGFSTAASSSHDRLPGHGPDDVLGQLRSPHHLCGHHAGWRHPSGRDPELHNTDGTITDNNTGLVWEKKTNCSGATHCVNDTYTWDGALQYVKDLNTNTFAGHSDWRLPNVKELQSIVNYQVSPAVSSAFKDCDNGSCTAASNYWSSSSYANDPTFAWFVNFNDGFVGAFIAKGGSVFVRAVRGGS